MPERKGAENSIFGRCLIAGIVSGCILSGGLVLAGFGASAVGIAGIAVAAGTLFGASIARDARRSAPENAAPSVSLERRDPLDRRDQIDSEQAYREGILAQLQRAETRARDRARLLLEVGRSMHPKLERLEKALARMTEGRSGTVDRRGLTGEMQREVGVLKVLLCDLLAFGEVESSEVPLQSIPFDLRQALRVACEDCPKAVLEMDKALPGLFLTDPALVRTVIERLLALMPSGSEGHPSRLLARADPTASDLMRVEVIFEGAGGSFPPSILEALETSDGNPPAFFGMREGEASLSLAIALRAAARLGGAVRSRRSESGGVDLVLDLVLPVTIDRRAASVDGIRSRNEALVSF